MGEIAKLVHRQAIEESDQILQNAINKNTSEKHEIAHQSPPIDPSNSPPSSPKMFPNDSILNHTSLTQYDVKEDEVSNSIKNQSKRQRKQEDQPEIESNLKKPKKTVTVQSMD